jgi:hypothetical protein
MRLIPVVLSFLQVAAVPPPGQAAVRRSWPNR